jgi:hypothetical protein
MSSGDYLAREDKEILELCKGILVHKDSKNDVYDGEWIDVTTAVNTGINAINEVELLRKENEQLKKDITTLLQHEERHEHWVEHQANEIEQLRQELQQAKDMLRDCLPAGDGSLESCHFCGDFRSHKSDCAYIKMIGGVE